MGILLPLVLPLCWAIMGHRGPDCEEDYFILVRLCLGVLAGAVWGDHCSPISDTTVMSSLSAGCDHIEHVRTQLPYALLAGAAALGFGTLPTSFGLPWWVGMLGATAAVTVVGCAIRQTGRGLPPGLTAPLIARQSLQHRFFSLTGVRILRGILSRTLTVLVLTSVTAITRRA
jgi:hypothetical protein